MGKLSRRTKINLMWTAILVFLFLPIAVSLFAITSQTEHHTAVLATIIAENAGGNEDVEANCPREGFYQTIDDVGVCVVSDTQLDTVEISLSSTSEVSEVERSVKTRLTGDALQAKPGFACPNGSLIDYINHQTTRLTVCSSKNIKDSGYALDVILDNKHYIKIYPFVEHLTIDP